MTTIYFGVSNEPTNTVNKSVTLSTSVTGSFRSKVDVLDPVVEVAGVDARNYNYCYIPDLERFYFIRNVEIMPTGFYKCQLHVDVLNTYSSDILGLDAETTFYEEGNKYTSEADFGHDVRKVLNKVNFTNPFRSKPQIVLVALQGGYR